MDSEDFFNGGDVLFNIDQRLVFVDLLGDLLHGSNGSSHVVVGPNNHGNVPISEGISGSGVIFGGDNYNG